MKSIAEEHMDLIRLLTTELFKSERINENQRIKIIKRCSGANDIIGSTKDVRNIFDSGGE